MARVLLALLGLDRLAGEARAARRSSVTGGSPELSSPRGRDLAVWLDEVERAVFSRTLTEAGWSNARIADREPADEVAALKAAEGRDILIVNRASIIRALLDADLVDEMRLILVPLVIGGGLRIFADELPRSEWQLASSANIPGDTLGLQYRRRR